MEIFGCCHEQTNEPGFLLRVGWGSVQFAIPRKDRRPFLSETSRMYHITDVYIRIWGGCESIDKLPLVTCLLIRRAASRDLLT